jgi:DNA-binding SARP family transcriptional activator
VDFTILGPLEVRDGDRPIIVAAGRERQILLFLLLHAGRVVATDRILDEIWGEDPPSSGAKTVTFHVARLRDALCRDRRHGRPCTILKTVRGGYVLDVSADQVDAGRFERLAEEGRALLANDPEGARSRLTDALALWRGEPLADVAYESFAQAEIARLEELRLRAREDRIEADLALGRHDAVIGELRGLVDGDPLRERPRGQLMTALTRAGRQAEALRVYDEGRRVLSAELGIEPSVALRQLQERILRQEEPGSSAVGERPSRNPYKGLRAFDERDAADFHGREALIGRLLERLSVVARDGHLLVVVGPSGSGKSSVVRAGLIPALRSGALPGSDRWRIAVMYPGANPFRELMAALGRATGQGVPEVARETESSDIGTEDVLGMLPSDDRLSVLVVDQFEEVFAPDHDVARQARFLDVLADALALREGRLVIIVTLRADAFDRPLRSPRFGELVRIGTEIVTPMGPDELERAITHPARAVGVDLEPSLTTRIIADVVSQAGELPLLQYALTELFERSDGRQLTRDGYAAVGGVLGALGRRAESTYLGLDAARRGVARQVFLRLVATGDEERTSARRAPRPELSAVAGGERVLDDVLGPFDRARLVTFDRDVVAGGPVVEVAHEALLVHWPRLAGWIDDARDDLRTRRRLADAAADWESAGRSPGSLLVGDRLTALAEWSDTTTLALDASERALLEASLEARERDREAERARSEHERALERRARTRQRAFVGVLALALIAALALVGVVYEWGESAREQEAIATARALASASTAASASDIDLGLLLALRAATATTDRGYITEEAMDALHWALQQAHVPYPDGAWGVAVASGPGGHRGIELVPPAALMAMADGATSRELTTEECRTYLHRAACPAPTDLPSTDILVHTASGVVPVERLAATSLAGTSVTVASELPADLTPILEAYREATGISVATVGDDLSGTTAGPAASSDPDVMLVARPATVADLVHADQLQDLRSMIDVDGYRRAAGAYLAQLGTFGPTGAWPSVDGTVYGATVAVDPASIIWYPEQEFESAGYAVPTTFDQLLTLEQRMLDDGRTPICFGAGPSEAPGGPAVDLVEDLLLLGAGPSTYDSWVAGHLSYLTAPVIEALQHFDELVLADGAVLNARSVTSIPGDLAALPMFLDPPRCWLHPGMATDRLEWSPLRTPSAAAFAFPGEASDAATAVRGRVYQVVALHDRPEIRDFVAYLTGGGFADAAASMLGASGLWIPGEAGATLTADRTAAFEHDLVGRALQAGTFRVDATDLMPAPMSDALSKAMLDHLQGAELAKVLLDLEEDRLHQAP